MGQMTAQFPLPGLPTESTEPAEGEKKKRRRRPTREELLEGLNDPQREAVIHEGAPLLVVVSPPLPAEGVPLLVVARSTRRGQPPDISPAVHVLARLPGARLLEDHCGACPPDVGWSWYVCFG